MCRGTPYACAVFCDPLFIVCRTHSRFLFLSSGTYTCMHTLKCDSDIKFEFEEFNTCTYLSKNQKHSSPCGGTRSRSEKTCQKWRIPWHLPDTLPFTLVNGYHTSRHRLNEVQALLYDHFFSTDYEYNLAIFSTWIIISYDWSFRFRISQSNLIGFESVPATLEHVDRAPQVRCSKLSH